MRNIITSNQFNEAITDFTRSVELKPEVAEAYNCLGYAYYKLGINRDNFVNALTYYDLATALGKKDYKPIYEYREMAAAAVTRFGGK